jgi:Putative Ig domain
MRDISTPLARQACCLGAALILIITAGCGGGSGGPTVPPGPPPTPPPTGLSYPSPQIYPLSAAIAPLNPAITGVVTGYSSSPALPPGLVIDAHTGIISGTPTVAQPSADYMISAANGGGSATFSLSIAVATVTASPANISRMVVSSTTVTVALSITPVDFSFSGELTAKAADTAGVFAANVTAVGSNGGSALSLTTSPRVPPGHYQGNVTLTLCSDAACTMPQTVPSIAVPYDVYVLSPASAWPGNNLSTLVPWSGVPDWTMFQANAAHTGYVPVDLDALRVLDPVTGAVNATIADPNPQNFVYQINGSAVLGAPGSVFAADYANALLNGGGIGNTLTDFNTTLKSVSWMVNGDYANTPAYNAGVVYAANNNPVRLEARAEVDGSLLWSWVPPQAGDTSFVSETLLTNTMIFVSTNLATYGIDTATHQTVWSYPLVGKLALSRSKILYIEGQQSQTSPSVPGTLTAINVN